jgi:formylglycine-generating enzyme required for sulfatase activity
MPHSALVFPLPPIDAHTDRKHMRKLLSAWYKSTITLGLDDPENDFGPDRFFGWDNERPSRKTAVAEFLAQARPISNGEYAQFLERSGFELLPASWSVPVKNGTSNEANGILSNGLEAGYVWDEHFVSVGSKQVRKPKKDGWYEHGMKRFIRDYRIANGASASQEVPASATVAPVAQPARH